MRISSFLCTLACGAALLSRPAISDAQARSIPVAADGWSGLGAQARVVNVDGREAFAIRSGRVIRRDVKLLDGTIDVDVRVTRARSFVYVQFRMESDEDHEEFYLRPHKSGLPDALQYAPVFKGQSAWQLFHGPGGTAAVAFEPGQWTRVRLVLSGRMAALFVGDTTKPALLVPRMARDPREGYIALRAFLPAGVETSEDVALFSNLVVRPGVVAYDFPTAAPQTLPAGTVTHWEISDAFPSTAEGAGELPPSFEAAIWRPADVEPNGVLLLNRVLLPPNGARRWSTAVRLRLRSNSDQTVPIELGFSDAVTAFLNGRPLFSSDARYSYDNPRQEGLIGLWQATAYLPLRSGDNELILLVSDQFGGWGVMGRIAPEARVTVESRSP